MFFNSLKQVLNYFCKESAHNIKGFFHKIWKPPEIQNSRPIFLISQSLCVKILLLFVIATFQNFFWVKNHVIFWTTQYFGLAHYAEVLFVKNDDFKPNFDTTYSRHIWATLLTIVEKFLSPDFGLLLHTETDLLSKAST